MLSYKKFILEAKFNSDHRENNTDPFFVSYVKDKHNPKYKYDHTAMKSNGEPMFTPTHSFNFLPVKQRHELPKEQQDDHSYSRGFIVDPVKKTVDFDLQGKTHKNNDRRPNYKLGSERNKNPSRSTPILWGGNTELHDRYLENKGDQT